MNGLLSSVMKKVYATTTSNVTGDERDLRTSDNNNNKNDNNNDTNVSASNDNNRHGRGISAPGVHEKTNERKKSVAMKREGDDFDDVFDVEFDGTSTNENSLAKIFRVMSTTNTSDDEEEKMITRKNGKNNFMDMFLKELMREDDDVDSLRWYERVSERVETPNGKIGIGCGSLGHPRKVLKFVSEELMKVKERFARYLEISSDFNDFETNFDSGYASVRAASLMCKSERNRKVFLELNKDILLEICSIGKFAASKLRGISVKDNDDEQTMSVVNALFTVCKASCEAILCFADPEQNRWEETKHAPSFNFISVPSRNAKVLFESNAMNALVEVMKAARIARARFSDCSDDDKTCAVKSSLETEFLALRAIGCAVMGDEKMVSSANTTGALDVVLEGTLGFGRMQYSSSKASLFSQFASLSLASASVSREISRKSARASEAKDRAVAGALSVAVSCSSAFDHDDAYTVMDAAFAVAASFISKSKSDEVASRIVNIGGASSTSLCKRSALKLRSGLARFVTETFNHRDDDHTIIKDAIIDAKIWEILLNSETFGDIPSIDNNNKESALTSKKKEEEDSDKETKFARKEAIVLVGVALDNKTPGDENALQHILSSFCQRAFHPSACEALAGVLLRIVYRNDPRDCRALIELEAPNRIAAAVHSQVRVWMCPPGMFVFEQNNDHDQVESEKEEEVVDSTTTSCARVCAQLLQAMAKETESPSLRLASSRSPSLLSVLFDDFLWVNEESLKFASNLATYIVIEQTRTTDSELYFDIDAFFLWIKAFFQALPKARIFDRESDGSREEGVLFFLLKSIRNIAKKTPRASVRKCQNWACIENGALFLTLTSLCDGESGENVAAVALETIHYAIKTSAEAAQTFEQCVGYDALIEAMRIDEKRKGSFATEVTLLSSLRFACDDDTIDETNAGMIARKTTLKNPGALRITFLIARNSERCSKSSQLFLLRLLVDLLERSVASRECATKADALMHLFEWWCSNLNEFKKNDHDNVDKECVENIAKCIESCAAHCITALQLRHAMHAFKKFHSSEHKRYIIEALKRAAINDAPRTFFDFAGGVSGGVRIRKKIAECSNGITISMWIRAEIENESDEKNSGTSTDQGIFSLLSDAGVGLCFSMRPDGSLKLSSLLPNGERHECSFYDTSCPIIPGKWMHIVVSVKGGGLILGGRNASASSANARVSVDGIESYPQKLKYPWNRANVAASMAHSIASTAVGDPILTNSSYEGANSYNNNNNNGTVSLHIGAAAGIANFAKPFAGQFATFRVFSEAFDANTAIILYALGAEYVGSFMSTEAEPSILLLRRGIPLSAARDVFEKNLKTSLKLTIDATAATGNMRMQRNQENVMQNVVTTPLKDGNSPNITSEVGEDGLCARVCSTTSAADVCRSLGGAEQLIPALLDDIDDLVVLPSAVALIAALLSDGGYPLRAREKIIALTAYAIPSGRLSKEIISSFDWLAKSCAGQQPRVKHGAVQTPEWISALGDARSEIFNPIKWAKCLQADAKLEYIELLKSSCSNAELLRVLPVRRIVRALEKYCSDDAAFREGLFTILEDILMDETIDKDGVYCIDAIESLCAAASRADASDGFLVDCLAFLRRVSKVHRFCFELVSNCGGFAIALAPMLLPNTSEASDSAMAARILHLAFSLPETTSSMKHFDIVENSKEEKEEKRGKTKAIENIRNALGNLAVKLTSGGKSALSAADKTFGMSESERRMDFAAANGAIEALGNALFGNYRDKIVIDRSSHIREALVELAIDGDDVNVKIKHPKAFAYFLRVTKSASNDEKYAHAKLLLSSLLESHENNAKALSQCKIDIASCLDANKDEDARILDLIPDSCSSSKDLKEAKTNEEEEEEEEAMEEDDWEVDVSAPAFVIQITQVEANIAKCDKRIADEQFAVEENEGSLQRLLYGLKSRWQKAQKQVFVSKSSSSSTDDAFGEKNNDGFYALNCEKEDSIGRRLRVRRDKIDALKREISNSSSVVAAVTTSIAKNTLSGNEENLPILQSAAKQWKDKESANANAKKVENSTGNEIEDLDGDLTESDEEPDEASMRNELEKLRAEEASEKSKLLEKQKTAEWLHSKADEAKRDKHIFFSVKNAIMVFSSDLVVEGTLDVAKDVVFFTANRDTALDSIRTDGKEELPPRFWKWSANTIIELVHMRWRLRNVALEMYTKDGHSVFFAFTNKKTRAEATVKIASVDNSIIVLDRRQKAKTAFLMQKRWKEREMSTFDYLIALNKLAGRTYHDLSQYPVFPWILSDYESPTINLEDPKVYRDLSLPVGALNPARLKQFIERFKQLEGDPDASMPAFHYGSHYSSAAVVLYYLIRLEPFTNLSMQLQGGKFDHPDRLFSDISQTWNAVLESTADVKELIPEFFYLPEFLENNNSNGFGKRQDGTLVDNIVLPKWANGCARTFIETMRDALESDHVSHTIHDWIDLVFGASQLGARAKSKKNVFYYLTYEGAVDLDAIEDPQERLAIETQIVNFGQTPAQVFKKPHPRRLAKLRRRREIHASVFDACVAGNAEGDSALKLQGIFQDAQFSGSAIIKLNYEREKLVAISDSRKIWTARVVREGYKLDYDFSDQNARLTLEPMNSQSASTKDQPCRSITRDNKIREQIIGGAKQSNGFGEGEILLNSNACVTLDGGRVAVVSGFWDGTIRAYAGDEVCGEIASSKGHRDIVECLALDMMPHPSKPWRLDFVTDGGHAYSGGSISAVQHRFSNMNKAKYGYLVSGGADASVAIWEIVSTPNGFGLPVLPKLQKFGHSNAVISCAVNAALDIVVSGSLDGTCLLHDLNCNAIGNTNNNKSDKRLNDFFEEELLSDAIALSSPSDDDEKNIDKSSLPVWTSIAFSTAKIFVFWSLEHKKSNEKSSVSNRFGGHRKQQQQQQQQQHFQTNGGILRTYSINGTLLSSIEIPRKESITSVSQSSDEKCVFLGTANGRVLIIDAKSASLRVLRILQAFSSLSVTSACDVGSSIFCGLSDGKMCCFS